MQLTLAQRQDARSQLVITLDDARRRLDEIVRQQTDTQARLQQRAERREVLRQEREAQHQAHLNADREAALLRGELDEVDENAHGGHGAEDDRPDGG